MSRRTRQRGPRIKRPRRRAGRTVARGLTLLEVMLAVILLGLVAVAVSSTVTLLARLQADDRQRLGAYELASRKILEYLDDKDSIGSDGLPQEMYGFRYRWQLKETPVRMTLKQSEAAARSQSQLSPERFRQVTVRVWLVDEVASANGVAVPGEEMATLSRIYDPFGILFRNADSRDNAIMNKDGLADIMRLLAGTGVQPQPGNPAATPAAPRPSAPTPNRK